MLSDDAKTKITRIQDELKWHVDSVRNDPSLTAEYKQRHIARHYLDAKRAHAEVVEQDTHDRDARRRMLEQDVLGTGVSGLDSGAAIVSRRDAGDRAAALQDEREALALLRRADRSGDEPLARAIAERALDEQWAEVGNAFIANRPTIAPRYEELWDHRAPTLHEQVMESWATMLLVPDEVQGMSEYRMAEMLESA